MDCFLDNRKEVGVWGVMLFPRRRLMFLLQVLYLGYCMSYLQQTCMDDAHGPTNEPKRLNWMPYLGHEFQML